MGLFYEKYKVLETNLREECDRMVAKERKPGRAVYMIVNVGYNQGNSHYPHWIRTAEIVPIHKGTAKTAKTYNGYRKTSILALVK